MARKRYAAEAIIGQLREAEGVLAPGESVAQVARRLGVAEPTYYRGRREDGGLRVDNAQESVDGQWYVFIIDQDGYTIAHHNPQFRGRDPSLRVDATGYFYGDDLLSATEAGHWVDYVLLNPESGENRQKHTWIVRHDGLLFGSGWYE